MFIRFLLSHCKDNDDYCCSPHAYLYEGKTIDWAVTKITSLTPLDKEISTAIVMMTIDKTDREHPMFSRRIMHDLILTVIRIL
jgi:L-fucose mutarotase/ribose pyranase (RbsD/FucU family)